MSSNRSVFLDALRSLAAVAVIVFHVLGGSAINDPLVSSNTNLLISAITATMQWHVPVFYMITGYLWFSDTKECTYRKMLPNIRRFVLVLLTVGYAYAIMERVFSEKSISLALLIGGLKDVLNGNLWDHMWYIYSALGIYLLLPVFKPFFANSSFKTTCIWVGSLFLFSIVFPIVSQRTGYKNPIDFPASSALFYVSLGGLFCKKEHSFTNALIPGIAFACSSLAAFAIKRYFDILSHLHPLLVCISAASIFALFASSFRNTNENRPLRAFADCTFGIYLFHPFFLNLMIKLLGIYPLRFCPLISLSVSCIGITAMSFATTHILRRIGWIRKYML